MKRWTIQDFAADAPTVARRLIGARLVRRLEDGRLLAGTIVETEAYLGVEDQAAHSFGGRRTPRNESMYGPPGTAYVYLIYGIHHCVNIVCGAIDEPTAVLIRALEPIEGQDHMATNRPKARRLRDLCSGPGKLCQALGIDRTMDGFDLLADDRLFVTHAASGSPPPNQVVTATRIGIDYADEWAHKPLRYCLKDNPHVSVKP